MSDPPLLPAVRVIPAPLSDLARELGHSLVKNVIALGVLARATGFFPRETVQQALRVTLHGSLLDVNERAFARGASVTGRDNDGARRTRGFEYTD